MLNLLAKAIPHQLLTGIDEPPFNQAELQGFSKIKELEDELGENSKSAGSVRGQLLMVRPGYLDESKQPSEPWDHSKMPRMKHAVNIRFPKIFLLNR